jgi:hypothetical protein
LEWSDAVGANHLARIVSLCSNLTLKLSGAPPLDGQADMVSRPLPSGAKIPTNARLSYHSSRRPAFSSDQTQMKAAAANSALCDGDSLDIANFKVQLEALRRWMIEANGQERFARFDASPMAALPVPYENPAALLISANDLASRSLRDEVARAVYLLGRRRVPRLG